MMTINPLEFRNMLYGEFFFLSPNGNIVYVVGAYPSHILQIESIDLYTK